MQATDGNSRVSQSASTSRATVSAVSRSYQNWLSRQSSATNATSSSGCSTEEASTTVRFCSAMNSLRASRAEQEKTRKMDYIRFGGHILIGVSGYPSTYAATLIRQLIELCDQKHMLKLGNESLPIERITKGSIMFLDHVLCRRVVYPTLQYTAIGGKMISGKSWYRYADNRKKVVNFCAYIIRGSLANINVAKYKLRSQAKVFKIGVRDLRRPLKEKK
nr:nuclear intron maturase 2, mitochondrial [Ipomoea batatas]